MQFSKRIVVGGLPRSGSTLLRFILATSPSIVAGAETGFFTRPLWQHLARRERTANRLENKLDVPKHRIEAALTSGATNPFTVYDDIMSVYGRMCGREAAWAWAEKTPQNCFSYARIANESDYVSRIHCVDMDIKFVSLVRNGLDVVTSLRPDGKGQDGYYWCSLQCYIDSLVAIFGFQSVNHKIVFYEDLVSDPDNTVRGLCDFIGIPYDSRMVRNATQESGSKDLSKVIQPKIKDGITNRWVDRYTDPKYADRVEEFRNNSAAMYWLRETGYDIRV